VSGKRGDRGVKILALFLLAGASAGAGCAGPSYDTVDAAYWQGDPEAVIEAYKGAMDDPSPNAPLGVEKMLSAALLEHNWQDAESYAVRASTLVNIFVAGEPGERDAISLFGQEKDKPFKGEPHERVMVDYYLGLLRFRRGDYEGALSAFRSAMNKDRGSFLLPVQPEAAQESSDNVQRYLYEDDYSILSILAAKCSQLLEEPSDAERYLERAASLRPELRPLFNEVMDPRSNVLVFIDAGQAPYKRRIGPQGAILGYVRGASARVDGVRFGPHDLSFAQCEDLYEQATTVGGRRVDEINREKAQKQEILHMAGFAAATAGSMAAIIGSQSGNRNMQTAGLIGMGIGIAAMIFAATAIDPGADLRAWTMLPGQIYLAVGRAEPGTRLDLTVRAHGMGDLTQEWTGVDIRDGVNLYWVRLMPGRRGGSATPPAPATPAPATPAAPEAPPAEAAGPPASPP